MGLDSGEAGARERPAVSDRPQPRTRGIQGGELGALSFSCVCGRDWSEHLPLPMRVSVLSGRLKSLRCPSCGKDDIYFVVEP